MTLRPRARLRGPRLGSARSERGSTSVQMVILMPVLFSVMFLGLQAALVYHARTVAIAAAQEGAGPPERRPAPPAKASRPQHRSSRPPADQM
jgi:Flp pilus assembly protein TadG